MKNFIEELRWRGMIQDIMPETEQHLMEGLRAAYVGIDPTADSLHIGHLVGVMMLRHFQNCGHKPYALVGGATGMIGDPSGKSVERNLLTEEVLAHNIAGIKKQLAKFLDFESTAPNRAELVNNYDWMKEFSFLSFIRDIGKHITVMKIPMGCRLLNSHTNSCKVMTFCIFIKRKTSPCKWVGQTNGGISPLVPSSFVALQEERRMPSLVH